LPTAQVHCRAAIVQLHILVVHVIADRMVHDSLMDDVADRQRAVGSRRRVTGGQLVGNRRAPSGKRPVAMPRACHRTGPNRVCGRAGIREVESPPPALSRKPSCVSSKDMRPRAGITVPPGITNLFVLGSSGGHSRDLHRLIAVVVRVRCTIQVRPSVLARNSLITHRTRARFKPVTIHAAGDPPKTSLWLQACAKPSP